MNLTNLEISQLVKAALDKKQLNLQQCCEAFNVRYIEDIKVEKLKPLNKDFVSRVTRNAFKVPSPRILKLCEFLEIEEPHLERNQLRILSDQISEFENQAAMNADFENRYSNLRRFLSGLNLKQMLNSH